jgi:hypothetical protein
MGSEMISVSVSVIADVSLGQGIRMRFVRDPALPQGWRPDLLIDDNNGTVDQPPSCFRPTDEVIESLNATLFSYFMEEKFNV